MSIVDFLFSHSLHQLVRSVVCSLNMRQHHYFMFLRHAMVPEEVTECLSFALNLHFIIELEVKRRATSCFLCKYLHQVFNPHIGDAEELQPR